ncbi:large conductance mechanosensitive channel protein MscL [Kitasatospora purpeofusca]|uniref:Large conductance mechanosensitive channel protein MscL n=1 Tax=Kitasatospora purpeofusca TaxID=67352 RepID=A0ABZ1U094_9ACTN|nr:large conductance mechanosensitive channel protein MscL [Kitasatospora purpeofusca]
MKGFKEFLLRGNVVDLAVAVVIGAAFTSIVNAFVKGVINPIVGVFGAKDLASYSSCIKGPCEVIAGETTSGILILWGSVLSAALQFLITAAVVYFCLILPMTRFTARRKTLAEVQAEAEAKEVLLLTEIRDALVTRAV